MGERSDAARPYTYWDGRQLRKGIIGGVGVCGCGHGANTRMPGTSFWEEGRGMQSWVLGIREGRRKNKVILFRGSVEGVWGLHRPFPSSEDLKFASLWSFHDWLVTSR